MDGLWEIFTKMHDLGVPNLFQYHPTIGCIMLHLQQRLEVPLRSQKLELLNHGSTNDRLAVF